ncbi:Hsp33 family molecular chaperone HslO [Parahaliea aestuarii]|uniref:33 kDa chaperonin n=1 Tax=Parahaliea aestuarii TaxID=1852021 RepID=A0A5C8ZPY2_9GAMM|nr:Hsp33 family molecular chaperone HslO [Parahaliea aestuarii]TXS90488.1 Hsp33 family molecular chaperone HslO [Parahaliea aestuarii]
MTENAPSATDTSLRFLFDEADLRGEFVQLDSAYRDILALHHHSPAVSRLLGEFLAAAVLLATTLKFEGKLILQARSEGQIPLLMVECSSELELRGIVRGAEQATAERFDLLLANGQLAITIDPRRGKRYQGVVPLDGDNLAQCLQSYFAQSEQLGTRLWLAADGERAGGLLLQQLPSQLVTDSRQRDNFWEHACTLAATARDEELLTLAPAELLHRLYHEEALRLFEPRTPLFRCSCSRERTFGALVALGREELESLLAEQGAITMDCEFCNSRYQYQREDLAELLQGSPEPPLH